MKGRKTGGRRKGTPNKTTCVVKDALRLAFQGIGGPDALTSWAKKNPYDFYTKLWIKLLPQEVKAEISGKDGGEVNIHVSGSLSVEQQRAEILGILAAADARERTGTNPSESSGDTDADHAGPAAR